MQGAVSHVVPSLDHLPVLMSICVVKHWRDRSWQWADWSECYTHLYLWACERMWMDLRFSSQFVRSTACPVKHGGCIISSGPTWCVELLHIPCFHLYVNTECTRAHFLNMGAGCILQVKVENKPWKVEVVLYLFWTRASNLTGYTRTFRNSRGISPVYCLRGFLERV